MIGYSMYTTILTLWKQGKSKKEIARLTGRDRKTIRKIIQKFQEEGQEVPVSMKKESALQKYQADIIAFLESKLSILRIHEKLKEQGCPLSYSAVRHYVAKLQVHSTICVRFHTEPGEEAQVDFGYVGYLPDKNGKRRKAWIFNMRLSYSRRDYYEVVFDQRVETFIHCHENALCYFGGVPKVVKIDNLKAGILEAHFYEPIYQSLYKQFADHYGFYPLPCRVRQPQEKGKVEAGIKYIKNNFFAGRDFRTYEDLHCQLQNWMKHTCDERIHGTTQEKPRVVFEQREKECLHPLPLHNFYMGLRGQRKVQKDCHITVGNNFYSVPFAYVGKQVEIEVSRKTVKIFCENEPIALHPLQEGKGKFSTQSSHYPPYAYYAPDSPAYLSLYRNKMQTVGKATEALFALIVQKHPQDWYRIIKGILSLRKQYSDEVINLACERALAFGITQYRKIKGICASGYYHLPLSTPKQEFVWKH